MTARRHAEIAGAGFGGLAAALALAQRGWSVRVHERAPTLRSEGFGIAMHRNGILVLQALGVLEEIRARALRVSVLQTRDGQGRVTGEVRPRDTWRMSRHHMIAVLARHAAAAGVEIAVGGAASAAEPSGTLILDDGRHLKADLVIGADGIDSPVRQSLGLLRRDRHLADGAMRLVIPKAPDEPLYGPEDAAPAQENWSGTRRIIYNACGPDEIYVAMTALNSDTAATRVPIERGAWVQSFPHMASVIERIAAETDWARVRWSPFRVIEVSRWSRGVAAILGDAAHAMPPNLGQGGGCALMNALSLAHHVADAADIPAALAAWEARERPITDHTQRLSRFYSGTAQWPAPLRSLVFGATARVAALRAYYQRTAMHVPTGAAQGAGHV